MALLEKTRKTERIYRHGGREVLRVIATHVQGESAAARHVEALVTALEAYALRELLPRAATALEGAVSSGTAYAFSTHRYRIDVREGKGVRAVTILLTVTLEAEGARELRELCTYWTSDGAWQKRGRHHRVR